MISDGLRLLMNMAVTASLWNKKMDAFLLDSGLNLNETMILYLLSLSEDEKMRRVDLAEKLGLTASGITRVLSPIEKLGLVKREANARDARVSYVKLTNAGRRGVNEALEKVEKFITVEFKKVNQSEFNKVNNFFREMGGTFE